ncbi:MAG: hypothetical protein AB7O68_13180 [Pirellulales bacterium]
MPASANNLSTTRLLDSRSTSSALDWRQLAVYSEWVLAACVSAIVLRRHWQNLHGAGGLWRDEAHTAELAQLPTWSEILGNLQWDSFPILSTALLRAWCNLPGGSSDEGLRWFGMLVGVAILASLWWMAYRAHGGPPSLALLLWGLSPFALRFGDSVRPHGLGFLWIVLAWSAISTVVPGSVPRGSGGDGDRNADPVVPLRWTSWLWSGALGICAVQTLFPNALILGGLLVAAAIAACAAGRRGRAIGLLVVGAVVATTLLPYLPAIRTASEWSGVSDGKAGGIVDDVRRLYVTLAFSGALFAIVWGLLPCVLVVATAYTWFSRSLAVQARRYRALFGLLAGALAIGGYFALMARGSFMPQPWHWLPVLLLAALAAEQILGGWRAMAAARLGLLVLGVLVSEKTNRWLIGNPLTNIDQAAARLNLDARPGDLVIVEKWYWGVSFNRYYHGRAPWITIPPMEVINLHRYDMLQRQMQAPDPTAPIREAIAETLQAGGRVWLVGNLPQVIDEQDLNKIRGQKHDTTAYLVAWSLEVADFLRQHELYRSELDLPDDHLVSIEKATLGVAKGWRP